MNFNADGTIQPIKLTKAGVGALRPVADSSPNLALGCSATASSAHPNYRVRPRKDSNVSSRGNLRSGQRPRRFQRHPLARCQWRHQRLVAGGSRRAPRIHRTEAYFVKPAAGHAYRLEWSLDGLDVAALRRAWRRHSPLPHRDEKSVQVCIEADHLAGRAGAVGISRVLKAVIATLASGEAFNWNG